MIWAREILTRRVSIVAAVTAILALLVNQGWIGIELSDKINGIVTVVFLVISSLVTVATVRPEVTPVDDPRDRHGRELVPQKDPHEVVAVNDTTENPEPEEHDGQHPLPYEH